MEFVDPATHMWALPSPCEKFVKIDSTSVDAYNFSLFVILLFLSEKCRVLPSFSFLVCFVAISQRFVALILLSLSEISWDVCKLTRALE